MRQQKTTHIFLFALLVSGSLHAAAYYSVRCCAGRSRPPAVSPTAREAVNLLEIGLISLPPPDHRAGVDRVDENRKEPVAPALRSEVALLPPAPGGEAGDGRSEAPSRNVRAGKAGSARMTSGEAFDAYLNRVRRKIESAVYYPRRARLGHLEGTVKVGFSLAADGRILSSRVVDGSSRPLFDRAALEILERAAPFPPPEAGVKGREIAVAIEFKSIY
jgi:TonB family protein